MRFRYTTRMFDYEVDWQERAACRPPLVVNGVELDRAAASRLFYSDHDSRRTRDQQTAIAICGGCDVRVDCLTYAIAAQEPCGIWGGLTTIERARAINARRRRGSQ